MVVNKEKFVENKELSFILEQLEVAFKKNDHFSVSVLITRLEKSGYKLEDCTADQVQ